MLQKGKTKVVLQMGKRGTLVGKKWNHQGRLLCWQYEGLNSARDSMCRSGLRTPKT